MGVQATDDKKRKRSLSKPSKSKRISQAEARIKKARQRLTLLEEALAEIQRAPADSEEKE